MSKSHSQEYVTIEDCEVKVKTLRAVLVVMVEENTTLWVPLSLIDGDPEVGDKTLAVAAWFAKKEGLI